LRRALGELEIAGVTTNRALLASVLGDEEFSRGPVATDFLELRHAHIAFGEPSPDAEDYLLAALWCASSRTHPAALWSDTTGWRLGAPAATRWRLREVTVGLERTAPSVYRGRLADRDHALQLVARADPAFEVDIDGRVHRLHVVESGQVLHLFREGRYTMLRAASTEDTLQATDQADEGSLVTPLPGTVVAVHVSTGERVERGAPLLTIEAMKMEHTVTAPYAGTIERIPFGLADRVAAGAVLVEISPRD
jgi:acetyl/propionyl-CoA carboxylase alpha subunit